MNRRPPRSTRTEPPFPYTTLCLAQRHQAVVAEQGQVEEPPRGSAGWRGGAKTSTAAGSISTTTGVCAFSSPSTSTGRGRRVRISTRFRSEEHTSGLQSLMRISYAVFCLKKKTKKNYVRTQHS